MLHFAANYIFNGDVLIKNSLVTTDEQGEILFVGKEGDAIKERPHMIFFNGIISPGFIFNKTFENHTDIIKNVNLNNNHPESSRDIISKGEYQRDILDFIKNINKEYPELGLLNILRKFTKEAADIIKCREIGRLQKGLSPVIILLENIDLIDKKLKNDTFVKILI